MLGWDMQRAITEPIIKSKSTLTEKHFETAASNGISKEVVYARIYINKWAIQTAITKPVKHNYKLLTDDQYAIAAGNGISRRTAHHRVKFLKWPIEKAITKTIGKTANRKVPNGGAKEYAVYKGEELLAIGTAKECGEELGLSPKTIRYYACKAYKDKLERWGNKGVNAKVAVILDKDDE